MPRRFLILATLVTLSCVGCPKSATGQAPAEPAAAGGGTVHACASPGGTS